MNYFGPIIEVEGIIGSGKTTLARELAKRLGLRLLEEPVDSNPYLKRFYLDPKRWAFPMQIELLHRRFGMHQIAAYEATAAGGYPGAIMDRSLRGDRVFARLHTLAGNIDAELEWATYERAYAMMVHSVQPPSLLLWLDVEPEKALNRIQNRARGAEVGIPLDYLVQLRDGYRDLLSEIEAGKHAWTRGAEVMRLSWNVDHQSIDGLVEALADKYHLALDA